MKSSEEYSAIVSSQSVPFDLYIRKGTNSIPDQMNFDAVIKQTQYVNLSKNIVDDSDGFIFAVHSTDVMSYQMNSLAEYSFDVTF